MCLTIDQRKAGITRHIAPQAECLASRGTSGSRRTRQHSSNGQCFLLHIKKNLCARTTKHAASVAAKTITARAKKDACTLPLTSVNFWLYEAIAKHCTFCAIQKGSHMFLSFGLLEKRGTPSQWIVSECSLSPRASCSTLRTIFPVFAKSRTCVEEKNR